MHNLQQKLHYHLHIQKNNLENPIFLYEYLYNLTASQITLATLISGIAKFNKKTHPTHFTH